jgi:multidrug resistance efflux pump
MEQRKISTDTDGTASSDVRAAPRIVDRNDTPPQPGGSTPRRRSLFRRMLLPLAVVVVLIAAVVAFNVYLDGTLYVSTDNAAVSGQPVPVGPTEAGRVVEVDVTIGNTVQKGEMLAEVELLSSGESLPITSPIGGVVIAVPGAVGATVEAGQSVVTLVDPTQLWVNANVDESQISRVRTGQVVDVHLDALNATFPGRVEAITPATAGTFSLLPQSNTTGNFTKVSQVVPVRISVDFGNSEGLLGSSASVRIHVE